MIFGNSEFVAGDGSLGFSITSPLKKVAHAATSTAKAVGKGAVAVGKGAAKGTVAVGKGTVAVGKGAEHSAVAAAKATGGLVSKYGKDAAMLAVLPVVEVNKAIVAPALKATVLRPVISRINTLKDRRAKKLAWDNRKSTTPTPQERSQAGSWTKAHLRSQAPPFGLMMSVLAGPPQMGLRGFGEPTTAAITAAVPALVALLNSILSKANSNGDAPENAAAGRGAGATAASTSAPDSGDTAPGSDMTAPGSGQQLPLGLTKKQLTIGGAVLGGVVLLALLTR